MKNNVRILRITHGAFSGVNLLAVKNQDGSVTVNSRQDAPTTIVIPTIVQPVKPQDQEPES